MLAAAFGLSLLLSLERVAAAGYVPIGCINPQGIPGSTENYGGTSADCIEYCSNTEKSLFAYFTGFNSACYCLNTGPRFTNVGDSYNSVGGCDSYYALAYKLNTEFTITRCISVPFTPPTGIQHMSANVAECFQSCKADYPTASWVRAYWMGYEGREDNPACLCTTDQSNLGTTGNCGFWSAWTYTLSHSPLASAVVRRQQPGKRRDLGLCPSPMQACLVAEASDQFECLDTDSELEACGGCMHGVRGINGTDATGLRGVDCTALPGVADGAVSCVHGDCRAVACLPGWTLVGGSCFEN